MANNVKLSLALLSLSSVFVLGCSQTDPPTQTASNSTSSAATAPNSAVSTPNVSTPAPANAYELPQTAANSTLPAPAAPVANTVSNVPTAIIRARDVKAVAGREMTLDIEMESKADITVMVFSLAFDPAVFTYVSSKISPGGPKSAVLTVNAEQTAEGRFGALIDSSTAFPIGKKPVMSVVFRVATDAAERDYQINFSSKPARQSLSTMKPELVDTKFEPATIRVVSR